MDTGQWISGVAASLYLALGVLALLRGARNPLALPLAFLCIAFFSYDTLEIVRAFASHPLWDALNRAAAALVAPPTLWLVATFVGRRRALRVPLLAASAYFVGLALVCALAPWMPSERLRDFPRSDAWATWMLVGMAPTFGAIPLVLTRHARRSSGDERVRTQLFGLAVLLGVGGVASELLAIAGASAPRVAAVGILISVVLLGALALRARVLQQVTGITVVGALVLASVAVIGHVLILEYLGDQTVLVVLGAVALTLGLVAAGRPLAAYVTEERERNRHLATLGRFSEQMAHDLRNPLAAIRGSAQFLLEETAAGRSIDAQQAFVELILEQCDRLARVVDDYQRLGRVDARPVPLDASQLVREVVRAQSVAARGEGVEVVVACLPDAPSLRAELDRELVEGAVENLVRNAREAIAEGGGGRIVVALEARGRALVIRVEDDGPGMDARTRERAFDEFFTTKATGSGLGLAHVARVARAHGGDAVVRERAGGGTVVEMSLPRAPA